MNVRNTPRQPLLDRSDGHIVACLGLLALLGYVRTLLPGLVPNDSAEFQTLAYTLDHAHTTGYEVYLLLAKLFTLLPVQDVAYRVNLFSAWMGALTVALVYLVGKMISGSRWGAALGALALAISATFWSQAIFAEVYTAGSAFTAAILLLVLLWNHNRRGAYLFAAGLLGGLGIGVHGSVSLLAPAVLVLLVLNFQDLRHFWKPALGGVLVGLALMVASFAVVDFQEGPTSILQAAYTPSINRWDMQPEELDSFGEHFAFLVFARQWRSAMFQNPAEVMPENLGNFLVTLPRDFSLVTLALSALGLFDLFARDRKLGLFFLVAILTHHLYTFNYQIGDIYVFYISFYVYLCVLAAQGVAALLRLLDRTGTRPRWMQPALALLLVVLALLPFSASRLDFLREGQARWRFMSLEPNQRLADWRKQIQVNVAALPENAIVLMDWYNLYGYVYQAHVEQGRTDLLFLEAYPYSTKQGMADSLFDFLEENIRQGRPVYTLQRLDELRRGGFNVTSQTVGSSSMYVVEKN